jgi:hypothetical protein
MFDLLTCGQRNVLVIPYVIFLTGATPSMLEGGSYMTVSSAATGKYPVVLNNLYTVPSFRNPVVVANVYPATTQRAMVSITGISAAGFTVEVRDDTGASQDFTNGGVIFLFGTADPR